MQDPFNQEDRPRKRSNLLLRLDSWINSSLWSALFEAGETWEEITIFFRRFRVRGVQKIVFELLGEAMTLGTAGSVLLLALALPAFNATEGDWRAQDDYAVTFLDRYGNEIGHRGIIHEGSVAVDQLPDTLIKSVVATEDRRFFEHYGIDFIGLFRAMVTNAQAHGVVQGGSTITQQLAKNVFLSNERTLERKVKEAFLAIWLECHLTKKQILGMYLDRMYMGGGTFGVAAAAQYYFGKDVRDIDLAESAMLAGLFKAPSKYAPSVNLPAARARADQVLTNLVQANLMTEGQVVGARLHPANVVDRGLQQSPDYFLDWAYQEVKRIAIEHHIRQHTLIVKTTVDTNIQQTADEALETSLRQYGEQYHVSQGAIVVHGKRRQQSRRGARDGRRARLRREPVQPRHQRAPAARLLLQGLCLLDGDGARIHAAVDDLGRADHLERMVAAKLRAQLRGQGDADEGARPVHQHGAGAPCPRLSRHHGDRRDGEADGGGVAGRDRQDHGARHVGADAARPDDRLRRLPRGRHGVAAPRHRPDPRLFRRRALRPSPRQPAAKAGAVERGGRRDEPDPVPDPEWGTGRRAKLDGIRTAGKTGTTQDYRDGWFCGFTGNYTAVVWIGNDNYTPSNRMTGGTLPAMTWKKVMEYANQGVELRPIPGIDNPLPDAKQREKFLADARKGVDGMEPLQRPRMLSHDMTALLRRIAADLDNAKPLKKPVQQVASTAPVAPPPNPERASWDIP